MWVFFEKDLFEKKKFFEKIGETPIVTRGLRTGYRKKFESIRMIPGTRTGTTPGIPSKQNLYMSVGVMKD